MGGGGLHPHRIGQGQWRGTLRLPEGCAHPDVDDSAEPDRHLDAEIMEAGDRTAKFILTSKSRQAKRFPSALLPGPGVHRTGKGDFTWSSSIDLSPSGGRRRSLERPSRSRKRSWPGREPTRNWPNSFTSWGRRCSRFCGQATILLQKEWARPRRIGGWASI